MASRRRTGVIVGLVVLALGLGVGAALLLTGDDHGRRPDQVLPPAPDGDGSVGDAVWSADGSSLYVADATGVDVLSGTPLAGTARIESSLYPAAAAWSPDHSRVLLSDRDGNAEVWDLATGDALPDLAGDLGTGPRAWSPDSERIATSGSDGQVTVHDVGSGDVSPPFAVTDSALGAIGLAWPTPDRIVAVTGNLVTAVDVATGEIAWSHSAGTAGLLAPAPDGSEVVVGFNGGDHEVYDVETGEVVGAVETESRSLKAADWSPDGAWVFAAGDDERPTLWDATAGETRAEVPSVAPYAAGGAWAPDSTRVAVPDAYDQRVLIIDPTGAADDEELSTAEDDVLAAAAWSPQGDRLAVVGRDGTIFVWAVAG